MSWETEVQFLAQARIFLCHHIQTDSVAHPTSYAVGLSGWGMKLMTHLCVVPKLRMSGATSPLSPKYVAMV